MTDITGATRFVGERVHRREDPRMLTGHGRYVANVSVPGMLHAAFLRSEVARGRIVSIDTAAALARPGVHAVFTAADLNPMAGPMWATMYGPDAPSPPARPLADGDVRFAGDAVAIVVADTPAIARDACDLIELDVEPLEAVVSLDDALADRAVVHPELGTNIAAAVDALDDAAWTAAQARAARVVTRTFRQARACNAPMEGRAVLAQWDPWAPLLTVWASTQNSHEVRAMCARLVGIPEHHVRVIMGDVGGGFGQKIYVSPDEACVILAAYRLQQPVRWVEDRTENLLAAGHARNDVATASVALDGDGRIIALHVEHLEDVGAFPVGSTSSSVSSVRRLVAGPYKMPEVFYTGRSLFTNTCGRVAYRGPWLMETTIREQLLDHAAREIGMDPIELRRRNVIRRQDQPYTSASGVVFDAISPDDTIEQAAALLGWNAARAEQERLRGEGRHVGIGMAVFVEPTGIGAGALGTDQATIRIEPSGVVNVYMGTGSTGNSLETTIPQLVAEHLGCALDDVAFHQGDTDSAPWGHGSGGSRAAVVSGGAAMAAAIQLRQRLVRVAAELLEAAPEDLDVAGGVVSVRGVPARSVSIRDVARVVHHRPEALPESIDRALEVAARYRPADVYTWSNACHACLCEVDVETGMVWLRRYVVSEDCGVMINPMIVEGQIAGGVAQGIGGALYEHFVYDADGNPLTATFADYGLPSAVEVPTIEYGHIETPSRLPGGFKGMGEGGAIASPSAVANAVADALAPITDGVTTFPLSPAEIVALVQRSSTGVR